MTKVIGLEWAPTQEWEVSDLLQQWRCLELSVTRSLVLWQKQSEGQKNEEATQRELGMRDEGCGHGSGELSFSFTHAICP